MTRSVVCDRCRPDIDGHPDLVADRRRPGDYCDPCGRLASTPRIWREPTALEELERAVKDPVS